MVFFRFLFHLFSFSFFSILFSSISRMSVQAIFSIFGYISSPVFPLSLSLSSHTIEWLLNRPKHLITRIIITNERVRTINCNPVGRYDIRREFIFDVIRGTIARSSVRRKRFVETGTEEKEGSSSFCVRVIEHGLSSLPSVP